MNPLLSQILTNVFFIIALIFGGGLLLERAKRKKLEEQNDALQVEDLLKKVAETASKAPINDIIHELDSDFEDDKRKRSSNE